MIYQVQVSVPGVGFESYEIQAKSYADAVERGLRYALAGWDSEDVDRNQLNISVYLKG